LTAAPRRFAATWAASRSLRAVAVPGPVQCLHLSSVAAHLAVAEGRVISLVAELALASPCAAVVPNLFEDRSATAPWRALDRGGVIERGNLIGAGLVIALESAATWNARPDWEGARRSLATRRAARGTLASFQSVLAVPGEDWSWAATEAGLLAESLLRPEPSFERARDAARRLVGRGPGLTPAGDDVLLGAFHALWTLVANDAGGLDRCRGALGDLGSSTTALAGAWLQAGAAGEAAFPWHKLLAAWASEDAAAVSGALREVAAIGASSGRAMLAGFEAVLRRAEQLAQPLG
jgi:hypothetical protein